MGGSRIYVIETGLTLNGTTEIENPPLKTRPEKLVLLGDSESEVNRREHGENVRLNDRDKDMQRNECNRYQHRKNAQDNAENGALGPSPFERTDQQAEKEDVDEVAGKDIGPEADREREKTGQGGNNLDGKKEKSEPPVARMLRGAGKGQQVMDRAMVADALPVEVEEGEYGAGQGHDRIARGSGKRRKNTEKV